MARKTTIAASRGKAKAEVLQLPLNTTAAAQAPAKPARVPVEAAAVVKKAVRKTAAKAAKPQPLAQAAGKPSKRPAKTAGKSDSLAEGQEMIATLESCGVLAAKGAESLGLEVVSLARGSLQAHFALTEALINAETLQETLTLQGNFARESLGNMTEGFTRLTGMSLDLTQTIMAPIHARVRASLG